MKHALMIWLASATVACGQVQYSFTNFAGMPGGPGSGDGTGSEARFNRPWSVAVDSAGNVYVAENNHTIRKITTAGAVTTLAGSAGQSGSADGPGSEARFYAPGGVAADPAGNVYVADTLNHTIRKITPAGAVTTLAGSAGQSGAADGAGSAARFYYPEGVAVDGAGNVYVADWGNYTIRKITSAGAVTTLAGSAGQSGTDDGTGTAARFDYPTGVAVDSAGRVYVADWWNSTIRKITPAGAVTTLAGSAGVFGSADGIGSAAEFAGPAGVAVDSAGNVYVADTYNYTIRKITPAGAVTTIAGTAEQIGAANGTGNAARFNSPFGVAVDGASNVYVADTYNNTIRKITPAGAVTTLTGSAGEFGSGDGIGRGARFNDPIGVAVDSAGNVYVADSNNHTIRKVTSAGAAATLAGSAGQIGSDDGIGTAARFNDPIGLAVDSDGNVYVSDTYNYTIRKITPAGVVTTLAGSAGQYGSADGLGTAAQFDTPFGVAVDTVGNVYVADWGNSTIRKITPAGEVTTLAGSAGQYGSADGLGSAAQFGGGPGPFPGGPRGVSVDSEANVYVADSDNDTIRKITPARAVTTLAGSAGQRGSADGTGNEARFNGPWGVAVDRAGNIYVADTYNYTIRKITPTGAVTTLAGSAGQVGGVDGVGSQALFAYVEGVAVDGAGNVYVTDSNRITKGTPVFRFQTSTGNLTISNGLFQMRLTGPFGSNAVVESSANLQAWTLIQTNALLAGVLDLSLLLGTNQNRFFRARLAR